MSDATQPASELSSVQNEGVPGAAGPNLPKRRRRALLAALGLLALAALIVLRREPEEVPEPPRELEMASVVYVDVDGWYQRSPREVAVASPLELALDALPAGLPQNLGDWVGEDRKHDPEVDVWFRDPEVVIERTYRRADGEIVWLSAFGSRGKKSFHLFEHTPDLCYPLFGWAIQRFEPDEIPMGPRPLPVNRGLAQGEQGQLVFLYLYVWDNPSRDPENGILSLRLAAPVRSDAEATYSVLAEDFLPEIFTQTLTWSRF